MNEEWLECRSDESNHSDHDYKFDEDPENMVVKKFKKKKQRSDDDDDLAGFGSQGQVAIKDPFMY